MFSSFFRIDICCKPQLSRLAWRHPLRFLCCKLAIFLKITYCSSLSTQLKFKFASTKQHFETLLKNMSTFLLSNSAGLFSRIFLVLFPLDNKFQNKITWLTWDFQGFPAESRKPPAEIKWPKKRILTNHFDHFGNHMSQLPTFCVCFGTFAN